MYQKCKPKARLRRLVIVAAAFFLLAACHSKGSSPTSSPIPTVPSSSSLANTPVGMSASMIPLPVSVEPGTGVFTLPATSHIYVEPATTEIIAIGQYLADRLNPSTGYAIQVKPADGPSPPGNIYLTTTGGDPTLGEEGYELSITQEAVTLSAYQPTGLFRGLQTLRQLFPPAIESSEPQPGPWTIPSGTIRDYPRFAWRGAMLDVARHFFEVEDVKRFIDLMAYYKLNIFHLHLTDDQGWRIMLDSWPNLALIGGSSAVGSDPGGYYTFADYAQIVDYARQRYITVVPEIDMPGHTQAALASYAELNCDGVAPPLYTGTQVGFSSLCINKELTYAFVEDVIRELAAMTPGPYLHIGGDEASATPEGDYIRFIQRVQVIVSTYDKQMVGWEEIAKANLFSTTLVQHYLQGELAQQAAQQGVKIILSPASVAYMDMKYTSATPLGYDWAGTIEVPQAYNWDPASYIEGITESDILGIEAPLWSETLHTIEDVEFMAFPRLPGYAEIGWTPQSERNWDAYKLRLAAQGPRLSIMGVNFYASPSVPWQPTSTP
jgi:hexosaminidase